MALIAADRDCKPNGSVAISNRLDVVRESTRASRNHKIRKMQSTDAEFSTDGLPKAFLHSLRTLFDILDDGKRGYVHISEIECRWQGADTQDLPSGVLECLRRVTPPHGCLTFERFVVGLRYSMLNPDNGHLKPSSAGIHQTHAHQVGLKHPSCAPISRATENKVRPLGPSNVVNTHQSRPRHENTTNAYSKASNHGESSLYSSVPAVVQGVHTRYNSTGYERSGRSLERIPNVPESASYRADLARPGTQTYVHQNQVRSIESLALESPQLEKASGDEGRVLLRTQSETTTGLAALRRHGRSRDEQRRHTITNGVDYGMLKQMKELEQEKDSLLAGLDVVERAREWYQNQVHVVTERQRHMGQSSHGMDFFSEQSQSRVNILLPKLQEVNRCLSDLISCSGMTVTSHGAPAPVVSLNQPPPPPAPPPPPPAAPKAIQRLKEQNRLLTQEVTEKSERITQLEQEKSALIKQLFEARARSAHDSSTLDSTFI